MIIINVRKMNYKKILRSLKWLPSVIGGAAFELFHEFFFHEKFKFSSGMGFIIATVCIAVITILIKFLISLFKVEKSVDVLMRIDTIGGKFMLSNMTKMFDVYDNDITIMTDIEQHENWFKRFISNANQTIYHSVTAKENLPWVEYIFWSFLRKVKDTQGCKVVIALHYDEKSREIGFNNARDWAKYKRLHKKYADIARSVLGKDITVIDEEDFRKKNSKFFATNFHNIFVKGMLMNIRKLMKIKLDYHQFHRKLSYLESVFPIMCLTKSMHRFGRLYILDRVHAHKIWEDDDTLKAYKGRHGIIFITGQTLCKEDNSPLRIFNPGDTIDINTTDDKITESLENADSQVKKDLLCLLSACLDKPFPVDFSDIDKKCATLVVEARTMLNLSNDLMC